MIESVINFSLVWNSSMEDCLKKLENEDPRIRLEALEYIASNAGKLDRNTVIKSLKEHILDWDDDVRMNVAKVLKIYIGR